MAVDWSNLLPEIVGLIGKEVKIHEDFINFMGVCSSWRSAVAKDESFIHPSPLSSRFPCLMLTESSSSEEEKQQGYRRFFLLSGNTQSVKLPESRNMRCLSSRGWLFFVLEDEFSSRLVHPRTRVQIDLPSLFTLPEYELDNQDFTQRHCVRKALLTPPHSDSGSGFDFSVFIVWGIPGKLGFCKIPGDGRISPFWTNVAGWNARIYDITYHNGRKKLYALTCQGAIQECNIDSSKQPVAATLRWITTIPRKFREFWFHSAYVLEWDEDDTLLVVTRLVEFKNGEEGFPDVIYNTKEFHVFEVDLSNSKWAKVESLEDRAIFIGFSSSFFVEASEDGCTVKANCIYFTDDCYEYYLHSTKGGGRDMGIYHMSDGSFEPYFQQESVCGVSPPLWLEPSYQ